ncbi:MAG: hypothetical protein SFU86_02830 [Pirellulaceae bacterium]|nr:hypothetical protein [Pirellulaceae bacterium]
MRWSDATRPPTIRHLRQFSAALAGVCAAGAGTFAWRGDSAALALACVTLAVAIVVIVGLRPRWLAPLYTAAMIATFPLAGLVSLALLVLIYYLLVTPLGLARRLFGGDPLERRWRPAQQSYWRPKPRSSDPRSYFGQF